MLLLFIYRSFSQKPACFRCRGREVFIRRCKGLKFFDYNFSIEYYQVWYMSKYSCTFVS